MVVGNGIDREAPDPAEAPSVCIDGRARLAELTERIIAADEQFSRAIREAQATSSGLSQDRIDARRQSLVDKSAIFKYSKDIFLNSPVYLIIVIFLLSTES